MSTTDPITAALTRSPRAYLPQIDYAADELADIRARLRARLPQVLPGWNAALAQENADPSARHGDAGLAILDALAVMIATLNLYADQRANESYVRTANLPRSLADLAALIDYRLGEGASAAALQAFYAKPDKSGEVPSGYKINASPDPQSAALTFETLESLTITEAHNALRVVGYDQSADVLRLASTAGSEQDVEVTLDAVYSGLKAGVPVVLEDPAARYTLLPAAITETTVDDTAATVLAWPQGAAGADVELSIATLTIHGRPQQNAKLYAATRADEITLGQNQLPVANAAMFTEGGAVLVDASGLYVPATVLSAHVDASISPGGVITLGRGLPASVRRSATRVLEATSCGYTTSTVRAGSTELARASFSGKKKDFPHTPDPGDLLLMVDASGVELATVASASGTQIILTQPTTRALRPVAHAFDPSPSVRFFYLDPNDGATHQTTLRPLLLGEVGGVYDSGNTTLLLEKTVDAFAVDSLVAVTDGLRTSAHAIIDASVIDGRTQLILEGTVSDQMRVARLSVYGAFAHRMHVAGYNHSEASLPAGTSQLDLVGALPELKSGQRLVLDDGHAVEGARITQVHVGASSTLVSLAQPLEASFALGDVVVYGNVLPVSHGAGSADEVLGSGDPAAAPQSFSLRRSPLAWVADTAAARGVSPALQVFVDGVLWHCVDSLAESGPRDRHYTLSSASLSASGRASIQFGDGRYGQAPASGRNNIVARYRVGKGADGNVDAGLIKTMPQALSFVARSFNPAPASGGADADTPEQTRAQAGLQVRALSRAVSLIDHADLARSYTGIAQARADFERESGVALGCARRLIVITCAAEGGTALSTPQKDALLAFLRARSVQPDLIRLRDHRDWPVRLALTVQLRADVQQASAQAALLAAFGNDEGLFAFERQRLGLDLALSTVYEIAEGMSGVDSVLATAFHPETEPAAVLDRIEVPLDAIATGGHASNASIGRLTLQLIGGIL